MNPSRITDLVRRVVRKAMSERGTATSAPRVGGVHVEVEPSGQRLRVEEPRPGGAAARDTGGVLLVTAEDLAGVPDGGTLDVAEGARLTPLAQDELWRRGIALRTGSRSTARVGRRALRVALGSDHGGFAIKEKAKDWLTALGHVPIDLGCPDESAVDYPDFARLVAEAVASGRADVGICIDGAGIGSAMAANKVPGVRAALCYDEKSARNAREHNFANVLTLGGKMLEESLLSRIVREFLATPEGAERHERRIEKISAIEASYTHRQVPVRRILPEGGRG